MKKILIVCTTDSMIWNFLVPHIYEMQKKGLSVECACSRTGFYFDELVNKNGFILHEINFARNPFKVQNIRAFFKLNTLIKNNRYDCIYGHEPVGGAMSRLCGMLNDCKIIYMAHGFHFYKGARIKNWLFFYSIEKFLSIFTDVLITINKEDYDISKKFYAKKQVLVHGIGIDTNKYKIQESDCLKQQFKLNENSYCILTVGELIPRKNHETIIKAMSMLDKNIHLFIAGTGELDKELKSLTRTLKLSNNVHFLGFCNNISEICNSCDLFVFPSIQEGLSMALMEAMACGKPIVASKIRGNVDLIDSNGGELVPVFDCELYAKAIEKCYGNAAMCKEYGEYNVKKVRKFDIKNVCREMNDIYKSV